MWPIIIFLGAGFAVYKGLFSIDKIEVTEASNCHNRFINFNNSISIGSEKKANLKSAHNTIRNKLIDYFYKYPYPQISFYIQGSYKMETMVENVNSTSDVDLGIYFSDKPMVKITTLQNHIKHALIGHTKKNVLIKKMCVRLNYVRGFHIDMPIYYKNKYDKIYFGSAYGWEKSDPKHFIDWFKDKTKNKPQLVRIIRYLKAWSNYRKYKTNKKFPSGLVLTLWAVRYYQKNERDDIAFVFTCDKILQYLDEYFSFSWKAEMPVAPYDNTLSRLTNNQRKHFYDEFRNMVEYGIRAISSENNSSAKNIWKQVFGYKFK